MRHRTRAQRLGLRDNTVVFFASDNGAHDEGHHNYTFFDSSGPYRGFKRSLYEGGRAESAFNGISSP